LTTRRIAAALGLSESDLIQVQRIPRRPSWQKNAARPQLEWTARGSDKQQPEVIAFGLARRPRRHAQNCGQTKPATAFVPAAIFPARECRAKRARERYQADADERGRQMARVRHNRAEAVISSDSPRI
jgi:hypothetical protein